MARAHPALQIFIFSRNFSFIGWNLEVGTQMKTKHLYFPSQKCGFIDMHGAEPGRYRYLWPAVKGVNGKDMKRIDLVSVLIDVPYRNPQQRSLGLTVHGPNGIVIRA
jgi:hypothetical protein